jgi:hypothetical protein
VDVVGLEAGSHELIAIRPREVEVKSACRTNAEPAIYCVSGMAGLPERLDHFFANFAAADAKARTNRRHQIVWIRSELACHGADTGASRALNRSPPSRVHGPHRLSSGIRDEDWRAVSDSNGDDEVGVIGEDDVRLGRTPFGVPAPGDGYAVAMDLTHESNYGRICTERGGNRLPLCRVAAQCQVVRREQMARDRPERLAFEGSADAGGCLRPRERDVRLRLCHDCRRHWD